MLTTAALYVVATAAVVGCLALVGYPVRELLSIRLGAQGLSRVPAPVLGLSVVQLISWWWLKVNGGPVARGVPLLLIGAGALTALTLCVRRPSAPLRQIVVPPALCLLGVAAIAATHCSEVFDRPGLSTHTAYNADAANYANFAQRLLDSGVGSASTDHLEGPASQAFAVKVFEDAFGATSSLAFISGALRLPVWRIGGVFLFAILFLCIYSTAWFLRQVVEVSQLARALASTASAMTVLFVYVMNQYFLAQLISMALLPVVAGLMLVQARERTLKERVAVLLLAGLLNFSLIVTYPAMAFVVPVLLSVVAVFAERGWVRRAVRLAAAGLGAYLIAAAVAPSATISAAHRFRVLSSSDSGWPLPGFLPVELAGFTRSLGPSPSDTRWVWSFIVLAIVASATVVIWRGERLLARYTVCAGTFILLTYGAVYVREGGPSYRQWKWVTMFVQVLVALGILAIAKAVEAIVAHRAQDRRAARRLALLGPLLAYIGALLVVSKAQPGPASLNWRPKIAVTERHAEVAKDPAVRDIREINIEAAEKWDTMWLAYFLREKKTYLLEPSYYATSPPRADWTIERIPSSGDSPVLATVVRRNDAVTLNSDFRFFREHPACIHPSRELRADGTLRVSLDTTTMLAQSRLIGQVEAVNTGTQCWFAAQAGKGQFAVVAEVIARNRRTVTSTHRQDLVPSGVRPVRPADAVSLRLELPGQALGGYVLRIQLEFDHRRIGDPVEVLIDVG